MQKSAAYLIAVLVGSIIWLFFQHYQIQGSRSLEVVTKSDSLVDRILDRLDGDVASKDEIQHDEPDELTESTESAESAVELHLDDNSTDQVLDPAATKSLPPSTKTRHTSIEQFLPPRRPETIRVASFHLHYFGSAADHPEITPNAVARIVRLFDVLAIQGLSPGGEGKLADMVAKAGSKYGYLLSHESSTSDQMMAFIYNRKTIVADHGEGFYQVGDPDDLLRRDPLVGWFRAKQAPEDRAFTFTLVNVHTDERYLLQELNVLDNVFHEVRQDWREEDDVIMLGCFHRPPEKLASLGKVRTLTPAVRSQPTDLRGTRRCENILFRQRETDEFTGRSGVYSFLRAYNMSLNQAMQVSEFLPVWAEFSVYESRAQR